jgi:hypothetical protein
MDVHHFVVEFKHASLKIWEQSENFRHPQGDMKQVPYLEVIDIRRHFTKCRGLGDLKRDNFRQRSTENQMTGF